MDRWLVTDIDEKNTQIKLLLDYLEEKIKSLMDENLDLEKEINFLKKENDNYIIKYENVKENFKSLNQYDNYNDYIKSLILLIKFITNIGLKYGYLNNNLIFKINI